MSELAMCMLNYNKAPLHHRYDPSLQLEPAVLTILQYVICNMCNMLSYVKMYIYIYIYDVIYAICYNVQLHIIECLPCVKRWRMHRCQLATAIVCQLWMYCVAYTVVVCTHCCACESVHSIAVLCYSCTATCTMCADYHTAQSYTLHHYTLLLAT
jgi:hypothetical protein